MSITLEKRTDLKTENYLFHPQTWEASEKLIRILKIVGHEAERIFPDYPTTHVKNIQPITDSFYRKNPNHYQEEGAQPIIVEGRSGQEPITLTEDQGEKILEIQFSGHKTLMPFKKEVPNAVFQCGVHASMWQRFNSLKKSIDEGHTYKTIYFIVQQEQREESKKMIEEHSALLEKNKYEIVQVESKNNILKEGLSQLQQNLSEGYAIISQSNFASKVGVVAKNTLPDIPFYGVASVPITWQQDGKLYGYKEGQTSLQACTILNFLSREVDAAARSFDAKAKVIKG